MTSQTVQTVQVETLSLRSFLERYALEIKRVVQVGAVGFLAPDRWAYRSLERIGCAEVYYTSRSNDAKFPIEAAVVFSGRVRRPVLEIILARTRILGCFYALFPAGGSESEAVQQIYEQTPPK